MIQKIINFLNIWHKSNACKCGGDLKANEYEMELDCLLWTCNKCGEKYL